MFGSHAENLKKKKQWCLTVVVILKKAMHIKN